jgi:hypothetical protein
MADVTPNDVVVTTWRGAGASAIVLNPGAGIGGTATLTTPDIHASAQVTVHGAPGEDVSFWRFGFIQLKFITDDWAQYRGNTSGEGSIIVAMDRPPARPQQLCRDSAEVQGLLQTLQSFPFLGPPVFYYPERAL